MSYIQKTIYALFLLALFSGCTDEVLDGGGNGSTPPIEEGKLVDVNVALGKAGQTTVLTRSENDSDEPEVDDEFLFLQYRDGELVYAWYTEEEDDVSNVQDSKEDDEIEGWGARGTVKIRLLSGKGYHVYVIANLELDKRYYKPTSFSERDDDNERGPVNITNSIFANEFGTEKALLSWRRNSSSFVDDKGEPAFEYDDDDYDGIDLDDEPVMFAVASNDQMGNETKVYRYTKMATNPGIKGDRVNDMINFTSDVPDVSISENSSICATLYQPYAKVALKIETKDLTTSVTIRSVEVLNCPLDYSLVNGFNLASDGTKTDKYTFGKEDIFKNKTLEENKVLNESFGDYVYIFENMAGVVNSSGSNQQGKVPEEGFDPNIKNYDAAAKNYTYIKVTGECGGKTITYRFILGSDSETNCNLERNVFYKVTMRLTGDAGVDEATWRVEYEGNTIDPSEPDPEEPTIEGTEVLQSLDAHESKNAITFKNMQEGEYFIVATNHKDEDGNIVEPENDVINKLRTMSDNQSTNYFAWDLLSNNTSIRRSQKSSVKIGEKYYDAASFSFEGEEMTVSFKQEGWFDYSSTYVLMGDGSHSKSYPLAVAKALPNSYCLFIYDNDNNNVGKIEVTQYPPIVVMRDRTDIESLRKDKDWKGNSVLFMERIEDDNKADSEDHSWTWSVQKTDSKYVFEYEAELKYWLNPRGPLVEEGDGFSRSDSGWSVPTNKQKRFVVYKQS